MSTASAAEEEMGGFAIERCLERLCEAVYRLHRGEVELEVLAPEIDWADLRGFGNRLRHEYDRLDSEQIDRILRQLPQLRDAAARLKQCFDPEGQPNSRPMA